MNFHWLQPVDLKGDYRLALATLFIYTGIAILYLKIEFI